MKSIWKLLAVVAIVGGLAACKKGENPSAKCYFADVETLAPLGDEYLCLYDGTYSPSFVAYDGTKVLPVDNDRHYITVDFLDGSVEYFVHAGMSAEPYGHEGWRYGFCARKDTPAGQKGSVRVTYDDGKLRFEKTFNLTADLSGGCEAVDLGLSVKWASYNVGAKSVGGLGAYFAWGETKEKTYYGWSKEGDYKWGVFDENAKPKYGMTRYTADVVGGDGLKTLQPGDDPATVNWGERWRTPTINEIVELLDKSKCEWTWDAARKGYTVMGLNTGKSIFLPAAGYYAGSDLKQYEAFCAYWSSSVYESTLHYANIISTRPDFHGTGILQRGLGAPIRAVTEY